MRLVSSSGAVAQSSAPCKSERSNVRLKATARKNLQMLKCVAVYPLYTHSVIGVYIKRWARDTLFDITMLLVGKRNVLLIHTLIVYGTVDLWQAINMQMRTLSGWFFCGKIMCRYLNMQTACHGMEWNKWNKHSFYILIEGLRFFFLPFTRESGFIRRHITLQNYTLETPDNYLFAIVILIDVFLESV